MARYGRRFPATVEARASSRQGSAPGAEALVGPHLVLVEAANILRRLEMSKVLGRLEATAAHKDLLALDILLVPFEPFGDRVSELCRTVTSYDAWYVAVAEAFDLPLATVA